MVNRVYKFKWIILSLIFWSIVILNIPHRFLDLGGDSAQYIILAESIAQGKGYKAVNYPGEPFFYHYPPVFPLLLSPIVYFFGRNFYLMHILVALLGFLSLLFLYKLFKIYIDKRIAFFTVFLLATNYIFVIYSGNFILSEIPYVFFSCLALLFAARYLSKDSWINREGWLLILFLLLSYFTRYAGMAVFLGILISLLSSSTKQKFKKFGFIFSGFILFFLLWQITARILNPSAAASYSKQFLLVDPYRPFMGTLLAHPRFIFLRFVQGAGYYYKILEYSFFHSFVRGNLLYEWSGFICFILILFGFLYKFHQNKNCVFSYYFLIYFLLIILWPFREGTRFILSILPFIYFYFLAGTKEILSFLPKRISQVLFYGTISFLLISNINTSLSLKRSSFKSLPFTARHFISCNLWMKHNLLPQGVIFSRKPTITYFYTNHQSIVYPFAPKPDEIWEEAKRNNVKYIIVDSFSRETYRYLIPFLYKYHNKLKLLHRIGNTGVFEVIKN